MRWLHRSRKASPTRQHNTCDNPELNLMTFSCYKIIKKCDSLSRNVILPSVGMCCFAECVHIGAKRPHCTIVHHIVSEANIIFKIFVSLQKFKHCYSRIHIK